MVPVVGCWPSSVKSCTGRSSARCTAMRTRLTKVCAATASDVLQGVCWLGGQGLLSMLQRLDAAIWL